jgi:beta-mannosidase
MKSLSQVISLDGPWTIEGMAFEEGLARKAYEPDYAPREPVSAQVPCIVQNALFEAGKIKDPYFERNIEDLYWIEEREWWYFRDFVLPRATEGRTFQLVFEGLTYRANVWLNGIALGQVEGMFLRHVFDVTRLVKPGGRCRLALRFRTLENSSEDRPGGRIQRGIVRSSGVVAPFTYYWNWSPHLVPIGIWKSVQLKVSGSAALSDPFVTTRIRWGANDRAEAAEVRAAVDLRSVSPRPQQVVVRGVVARAGSRTALVTFRETASVSGRKTRTLRLKPLRLQNPRLWWPNGLGDHPLYELRLTLEDRAGRVLDTAAVEFGVRELKMLRNTRDEWVQQVHGQSNRLWSIVGKPYRWTFCINRKKVFARGTNWLPLDNLFRLTEDRYRLFLDQVEDAHLNMVRVWGGGIQETETFYRLCDRRGILTWADFWLSCASYPAMPQDLFIRCAVDMIRCIRNHPSLVLYCGGNEYNPDEPENKDLVDRLAAACAAHDRTREFHRGSPYKGNRHGGLLMMPTRTSNKYNGDILSGASRLVLFRSEVAVLRSAPLIESIRKFIAPEHLWPIDERAWDYHHAVIEEQARDAREFGAADDLEHWLMAGQIAHGQVHRHNLEYCRQSKYLCSGCLQWQINSSWPTFHRELIDYYGVPKPAYYAYKRAARDLLVCADMEKYVFDGNEAFEADVYAVTERHERLEDCAVHAVVYDSAMSERHRQTGTVALGPDNSVRAFRLGWRVPEDYLKKVFLLHLTLTKGRRRLAENLYWMGTSAYTRPKALLHLNGPWSLMLARSRDEGEWNKVVLPSYWTKPPRGLPEGMSAYYRTSVAVPADWRGLPLEFFSAGLEGNDEVFWNGTRIGGTEKPIYVRPGNDERVARERWAERMAREQGVPYTPPFPKPPTENIRVSSDPFTPPNLLKRFYPIPDESVRWGGENVVEIRLYGRQALGISEPVFIRRASTPAEQRAIIEYEHAGAYLADLRNLPEVDLDADVAGRCRVLKAGGEAVFEMRLKNATPHLAFFTGIHLDGLDGEGALFYSDNYFALLPGAGKSVTARLVNSRGFRGRLDLQFALRGWNVRPKRIGRPLDLTLG